MIFGKSECMTTRKKDETTREDRTQPLMLTQGAAGETRVLVESDLGDIQATTHHLLPF